MKDMATRTGSTGLLLAALLSAGCSGSVGDTNSMNPATGGPGSGGQGAVSGSGSGSDTASTTAGPGNSSGSGNTTAGSTTGGGGGGAGEVIVCSPGIPGTSQIPRLKNIEYNRTVRDLLGVTGLAASNGAAPSSLLATDQSGNLSDLGWSSYQTVAGMIAAQVMADPALKANFLSCDPAEAGCIDATITSFGRRAFRRPLTETEAALFQALNDPTLTANGTPEEVAELVLYGFLVSPVFLSHSEMNLTPAPNGGYQLSNHEIASRLSYMLWQSMPDSELDRAADAGELSTKEQILAQAKRMLGDPRARDMVTEFHRSYLHLAVNSRWDTYVKDPTRFPNFSESLRGPLSQEVERFFDETTFSNGTFQDLMLSTRGYVNADTAPLYSLPATGLGSELTPVDLPGRPGFLTRVGWLAAFAEAGQTSPIIRGAFILKDVMGFDPGAPPPGASQTPLPEATEELNTIRKRVDDMTKGAVCANCHHEYINPPGFVMEAYDSMGAPQTVEASSGEPIDTAVELRIDGELVPLSQPAELMALIAASPGAQRHYAQKWVQYAFDRVPNPQDACTVDQLVANIAPGGFPILDLIADLTLAESFTVRAIDTGVAP